VPRIRATFISVRDSTDEEIFSRTAQRKPEFASAKITYFSFSSRARTFPPHVANDDQLFRFHVQGMS
jgi:hypothetical protein